MKLTYKELEKELKITDNLLNERQRVLEAIPECRKHGKGCVYHALEWIEEAKAAMRWVESQKSKFNYMASSPNNEKFTAMIIFEDQLFVSTDSHIYRWNDDTLQRIGEA